jgi:hypothetical protein
MRDDVRSLVREILQEELQALRSEGGAFADTSPRPQVREEAVSLASDADLNDFVLRILDLAQDGKSMREIKAGRWRFRLQSNAGAGAGAGAGPRPVAPAGRTPGGQVVSYERGLVCERQIGQLPAGAQIRAGKRVRFTPLAQDEIRRKGIRVERTGS